ncbi:uncharacterized protein with ACT and thioredoxin-like domain [Lysinibacillus parviboronicapiens]|uniref:Uncharacterized protein with ACT and thioredoxin-like domain n=1 Tax=Lysinibacillus parviboronicapiens TaxID=436516 RepID=A0ABV2PP85_9BACI
MNNVELTDDELALMLTSLQITIASSEKYIERNGKEGLDDLTLDALEEMKILYEKMKSKYY